MPDHLETIKRGGKIIGYRVRMMRDGVLLTGPQAKTKSAARLAFSERIKTLNERPLPGSPSLSTLVKDLLDGRLRSAWKHDTLGVGRAVLNYLEQTDLGDLALSQLTPAKIEDWRLTIPVSDSSGARYQKCLEKMLLLLGVKIKAPRPSLREPVIRILTRKEQKDLLERAYLERSRLAIRILLSWGIRAGEACGLRHEDRFESGVRIVRQICEESGGLVARSLKTDASQGWLPFFDEELERQIGPPRKGYVLGTANGTPMRPSNLRRLVQAVAKGTAYEGVTPHELRHTAAVNLIRAGVPIPDAASITRHSVETLTRIYYRVSQEAKIEAGKKLKAYLESA